ncbi:hypothetical protein BDW67DRAFT_165018, partial [Aspergillus spinulosporus]
MRHQVLTINYSCLRLAAFQAIILHVIVTASPRDWMYHRQIMLAINQLCDWSNVVIKRRLIDIYQTIPFL